jgi:hypothetical protein
MMKYNRLKLFIVAVAVLLGSCGGPSTTSKTFGPSEKTLSGYNFTLALAQTVLQGPNVELVVHVYSGESTSPAPDGTIVNIAGDVIIPAPQSTVSGLVHVTVAWQNTLKPGSIGYVTATVEDKTVQGVFEIKTVY